MLENVVIGKFYKTPEGVCYVCRGKYDREHDQLLFCYKHFDGKRSAITENEALRTWKVYDGNDFPEQTDKRLPACFGTYFDIKRESELAGMEELLETRLTSAKQHLDLFNTLLKDYDLKVKE